MEEPKSELAIVRTGNLRARLLAEDRLPCRLTSAGSSSGLHHLLAHALNGGSWRLPEQQVAGSQPHYGENARTRMRKGRRHPLPAPRQKRHRDRRERLPVQSIEHATAGVPAVIAAMPANTVLIAFERVNPIMDPIVDKADHSCTENGIFRTTIQSCQALKNNSWT